jgi:hypothetical protein
MVLLAFSLVATLPAVPACDIECPGCTTDDPCPDFVGTYWGTMTSVFEACDVYELQVGEATLEVISMTTDESGEVTSIVIEMRDLFGMIGIYRGRLCNTEDKDFPKYYAIETQYEPSMTEPGISRLDYRLFGHLYVEGESGLPGADLNLRITFFNEDGSIDCELQGRYTAPPATL